LPRSINASAPVSRLAGNPIDSIHTIGLLKDTNRSAETTVRADKRGGRKGRMVYTICDCGFW